MNCNQKSSKRKYEEFKLEETFVFKGPHYYKSDLNDTIRIVLDSNNSKREYRGYWGGHGAYLEWADFYYTIYHKKNIISQFTIIFFSQYSESESSQVSSSLKFIFDKYSFEMPEFNGFADSISHTKFKNDTVWLSGNEYNSINNMSTVIVSNKMECPIIIKLNSGIIKFKINNVIYYRIFP
jgi:hypothetical protein